MTETVRYSQIGEEDINLGQGSFEVELADGRHVILTRMDIGRILADPRLSSPFTLQAYERTALPSTDVAGLLARVTDETGGLWMSAGSTPWMALNGEVANVKDAVFGALGDGLTDDTDAITKALATGKMTYLPPGTYLVSGALPLIANGTILQGAGPGLTTIRCAAGSNYQNAIQATGLTNVMVRDLTVDLNQGNRVAALTSVVVGIDFEDCIESSVINCVVKNGIGAAGATGVGINFGGANTRRGLIRGCIVRDCGIASKASDAIYTKGQQNLIVGCIALNCTDTAFVIENSDQSGIIGCTARSCGAGAAITAATTGTYSGNYIDGLSIYDWNASVSGGIQLGAISGTANLQNTVVANVILERVAGSGPAINIKQEGGLTTDLSLRNCRIKGAGTGQQGVLVRGSRISIMGCHISDPGNRCIQIQIQSSDIMIANNFLRSAVVGEIIQSDSADDVVVVGNVLRGDGTNVTHGVYFSNSAQRCHVIANVIYGVSLQRVGSDGGTIPLVIDPEINGGGGLMLGKQHDVGIVRNTIGQLGLNEFAPTSDIKWGRPVLQFGVDAEAPAYITGTQTGWLRVIDSAGNARLIPLVNPV